MRISVRFFVFEEGGEYFATGVDVAAMGEGATVIDAVHGLKEALLALAEGSSGRERTFTQAPPDHYVRIQSALVSGLAVRDEDWRETDFAGTPVAAGELVVEFSPAVRVDITSLVTLTVV